MADTETTPATRTDRVLGWIERAGNRLPEPFLLFVFLLALLMVVSTVMDGLGAAVTVPGDDGPTAVRGALTGDGVSFLCTGLAENFIDFPPLQNVITIMLGVGLAERTGLLAAVIRLAFGKAPRWLLPYALGLIGVTASIMSDSSFIVIPPLAALVFAAAGRHPVAGLLGGFAAVGAGYSTSLLVTPLDALFSGISSKVAQSLPNAGAAPVTPVSNYLFNVAASVVLALLAGVIIARVIEPGLERAGFPREPAERADGGEQQDGAAGVPATLDDAERRALRRTGLVELVLVAALLVLALVPGSPLRNGSGGFLPKSPLLDSVVTIIFVVFFVPAVAYGAYSGTIRRATDVPLLMGTALRDLSGFIVLAFVLGQFIAVFDWTNIGSWIAVKGADALRDIGLTGLPAVLGFIVLASLLNLFIISGSSLWTLMASVFVPLFLLLGLEPGFTQAAFRVGDSATQVMTPLNPYMIVLLGYVRRYLPGAGLGTVVSRMVPFVVPFWVAWVLILVVFYLFDLPLGPGMDIRAG